MDRSSQRRQRERQELPKAVRVHESHPIALPPCFSPGPGTYNYRDGFDDEFRFAHSGLRKGFTIGGHGESRMASGIDSPGPKYDIRQGVMDRGYKFSTATRFLLRNRDVETPSPASYNPRLSASSWFANQPRVVFSPKNSGTVVRRRPPANVAPVKPRGWAWKQHQEMQLRVAEEDDIMRESASLKKASPKVYGGKHDPTRRSTFGQRTAKRLEDLPGPGAYDVRGQRPSSRRYCVMSGTGHRSFTDGESNKGPPIYFPNVDLVRPRSPCGLLYLTG